MAEKERPILITLISVLEMLAGLALLAVGVLSLMGMSVGTEVEGLSELAGFLGIGGIIGGLFGFAVGYGMFKGWRIMWYLGVIFNVLSVILGLISLTFVSLIVSLIILYYLFRPKVKTFFNI